MGAANAGHMDVPVKVSVSIITNWTVCVDNGIVYLACTGQGRQRCEAVVFCRAEWEWARTRDEQTSTRFDARGLRPRRSAGAKMQVKCLPTRASWDAEPRARTENHSTAMEIPKLEVCCSSRFQLRAWSGHVRMLHTVGVNEA